jgi:hypothetical protein
VAVLDDDGDVSQPRENVVRQRVERIADGLAALFVG